MTSATPTAAALVRSRPPPPPRGARPARPLAWRPRPADDPLGAAGPGTAPAGSVPARSGMPRAGRARSGGRGGAKGGSGWAGGRDPWPSPDGGPADPAGSGLARPAAGSVPDGNGPVGSMPGNGRVPDGGPLRPDG